MVADHLLTRISSLRQETTAVFNLQHVTQTSKNLPAMLEMQVLSLGGEDPLEKEMATHSGILDWRILRTEESGGL